MSITYSNHEPKSVEDSGKNNGCSKDEDLLKMQRNAEYAQFYEFKAVLGEGSFCRVFLAIDLITG